MKSYAGIGSREVSEHEKDIMFKIADKLHKHFILYSGAAPGSDRAFIEGSHGNCVLFLPWASFESQNYDFSKMLDVFDVGKSPEGMEAVAKYHPNPNLKYTHKLLLSRNFHQVMGYGKYPRVSFVVYCANEDDKGNVEGGTRQAIMVARNLSIPTINIRKEVGWQSRLQKICKDTIKEHKND